MKNILTHTIYTNATALPDAWDAVANRNVFLSRAFFEVLEKSAPLNMKCFFIGFFEAEELVGVGIAQFLDMNNLESFGERNRCLRTYVRDFLFRSFASHVLFMGNNLLTGQNAFTFLDSVDKNEFISELYNSSESIRKILASEGKKVHITSFKDFTEAEINLFPMDIFKSYYRFSIQPNMIFEICPEWNSEFDYVDSLIKKYRDQYKRSHKKAGGIEKRKMDLAEIREHENLIYDLYFHVARNAPFNTFFLAKDHFSTLKSVLKDKFLFYGYFLDGKLVGFNTLIKNGNSMDTYFLGYDDEIQKEKMLYLNMLYDMTAYSINKGYREVVFGRTALEIKSSIGARPEQMFGLIKHSNKFLNKWIAQIFDYLEPKTEWQQRHPFK